VLQRHNLDAPEGKAFARGARDWWRSLPLSMAEQLREGLDLAVLDALDPLEACVEKHGSIEQDPSPFASRYRFSSNCQAWAWSVQ
jgi:hypothetical protein